MSNDKERASARNSESDTVEVPVVLGDDGYIDVRSFLATAEKLAVSYREESVTEVKNILECLDKFLQSETPEHKNTRRLTLGALANLVISCQGKIPTEVLSKRTKDCLLNKVLPMQKDKFYFCPRGRNSGFHIIARYSEEEMANLVKSAD